jgi:uncharacterized protein YqgC (DUF456 family)
MILIKTILYIIGFISFFYYLKPSLFFLQDGSLREYGVGYDSEGNKRTLVNFHLFIILLSVFIYKFNHDHVVKMI